MMPIRTCVGCGERAPQAELVRFVGGAAGLVPDLARRAPGRGAYLHPRPTCRETFVRRRGPVRSLRLTPSREQRQHLVAAMATGEA